MRSPRAPRSRRAATGREQPVRTCVGCRQTAAPTELVRIRRDPAGGLEVGAGPGRGAWLCRDWEPCFEAAQHRRALDRALRTAISATELSALRARLESLQTNESAR